MVGDDAHGDIGLLVGPVGKARPAGNLLNQGLEDIRVVVGLLALHHHAEALEAHARVDMLGLQGFQSTIGQTVVLHEYEVPYLDDQRVVLVDQLASRHLGLGGLVAQVDMDFAAGAAGTLLAHLPEVVLARAAQDAALVDMGFPEVVGLGVHAQPVALVAAEDGDIELRLVNVHHLGEELPSVGDGLLLKIIPETPVSQHLEHGVVVGIVAHLFEVVVLTADTQTLLCVAHPRIGGGGIAQENILELVHAGVGEHQSGVVLHHHRGTGDDVVALALEEIEESLSYFVRSHILNA